MAIVPSEGRESGHVAMHSSVHDDSTEREFDLPLLAYEVVER